jgi:hypothetical protein
MSDYSRRSGPGDRELRVGDAEREAVGDILRREHLAGRIDNEELDERVARSLAAKTYNDLDQLIRDFPATEPDLRPRGTVPAWRRGDLPYLLLPMIMAAIVFSDGRAVWLLMPFIWLVARRLSLRGRLRQTIRAR